jgi:hypothetical protein
LENQDGILANLKQENMVLWMTLKEMEDAKTENKKVMNFRKLVKKVVLMNDNFFKTKLDHLKTFLCSSDH